MSEIHGRNKRCQLAMIKQAWFTAYCSIIIGIYSTASSKNVSDSKIFMDTDVEVSDVAFFFVKFSACREQPVCQKIGVISSATSRRQNVWYISSGKNIFRVQFAMNKTDCNCTKIFKGTNSISSLLTDGTRLFWLRNSMSLLYFLEPIQSWTIPFTKRLTQDMVVEEEDFRRAGCYLPQVNPPSAVPIKITSGGASYNISNVIRWKEDWLGSYLCQNILNPSVKFGFFFVKLHHVNISRSPNVYGDSFVYQPITLASSLCQIALEGLQSNSVYQIYLIVTMESGKQKSLMISNANRLTTLCEEPSSVTQFKCVRINSRALRLTWNTTNSVDEVVYEVLWRKNGSDKTKSLVKTTEISSYLHNQLEYNNYTYMIRTYPLSCKLEPKPYNEVIITDCRPFHEPASLISVHSTDQSLSVLWEDPEDNSVQNIFVEWMEISITRSSRWHSSKLLKFTGSFTYTITDLKSNTGYKLRTSQQYVGYNGVDGWTTSAPIVRKTKSGTPGFPHNVTVISDGILSWSLPNDSGSPLKGYIVWCRNESSEASFSSYGTWKRHVTIFKLEPLSWKINNVQSGLWYQFRVSAFNKVGEGDRSLTSNLYFYQIENSTRDSTEVIGLVSGVVAFVVSLLIAILVWFCRTRHLDTSITNTPSSVTFANEITKDVEKARLPQQPTNHEVLDSSKSSKLEPPSNLPLLSSENLELLEFLGKGAFGEVYEGIAYDIGEEAGVSTRVAVKVLRDHSDGKKEFLMEARIMSNFHHKNILSLLGVCWEDKHQYLVMELMEGGDLSHYLREAKPTSITLAKLSTVDLVDICLDIATGCKYLEEQHFIHRDLAARNCLVSTKDYSAHDKVVKIGDFGLARDIYRSEYYHKHDDGLLPVRWMAPESLEQNVYTTQSDVWSFGILLWEVMSYAKRPYQIISDIEILQFIKAGGRLDKPDHCPDPIYLLMTKCWLSSPIFRPSFAWALEFLHNVKDACSGYCDTDSDALPGAYATASTSDEDFADEGIRTSRSPSLESRGHSSIAFEAIDEEDTLSIHSRSLQQVDVQVHQIEEDFEVHEVTQCKELFTSFEDTDDDNYSPSDENIGATPSIPSLPTSSRLLPYIGDLPITDEERLLRKKQWNRQVSSTTKQ